MIMGALVGEAGLPVHWRRAVKPEVRANCVRLACGLMGLAGVGLAPN
jgi:ADP-ribosyl-[dinitrogen reductase] hydrolase